MASFNIVFTNRPLPNFHVSGEIDLVGWDRHSRDRYSDMYCRSTINKLYRLQAHKDQSWFEKIQRQELQKLLAFLWQCEAHVDYPVLLFGAAKNFLCTEQRLLRLSKTTHFTLQIGSFFSEARAGFEEESDYLVSYLCLYAFQDQSHLIPPNMAITQAWQMRDVALEHFKELRFCYGEHYDAGHRPYTDDFPEPNQYERDLFNR